MQKTVIKKDGRKESFVKEKIVVSAIKSGASIELARDIAKKLEEHPNQELKTSDIRKSVVDSLNLHNPELPKRWYNYDKNVKRLHKYMY